MDHRTTVLIADNSEEFCSGLSAALTASEDFQVLGTAADGEQALRLIAERKPEILVLDLMLPKRDGISMLKAIAAMEQKPITLATSGFVTDYVASTAANLGHPVSAFQIMPNLLYPFFLLLSSLVFIFLLPERKQ